MARLVGRAGTPRMDVGGCRGDRAGLLRVRRRVPARRPLRPGACRVRRRLHRRFAAVGDGGRRLPAPPLGYRRILCQPARRWPADVLSALMRTIVTGGNSGVGKATAAALAGDGHSVILACRSLEKAERAAAEMSGDVAVAHLYPADLP